MLRAISRYGTRVSPEADEVVAGCERRGQLARGPHVERFEEAFADRLGGGVAVTASRGRTAFLYVLQALGLPPGSEIVFPALTFWVMPEMARAAGLRVTFADVNPDTFNLDPASLERAITPQTRAVVPTHLYGLPCDMYEILAIARRHGLRVIEDCAHALGATYRGRPVGTFGDAAIFSFQLLKPLNTFGGGLALLRDPALGHRVAAIARADPWPREAAVRKRLRLGRLERRLISPPLFSLAVFPILWSASWLDVSPDVYLWERIRPLYPLPSGYRERYSNVQAALGLAGLEHLDEWTFRTRAHAAAVADAVSRVAGVRLPADPADRRHIFYQYCVYVPDRVATVRACLRRGLDVEHHHMDVCSDLGLFGSSRVPAPGARRTTEAVQVPVHASLSGAEVAEVARRFRAALAVAPTAEAASARLA